MSSNYGQRPERRRENADNTSEQNRRRAAARDGPRERTPLFEHGWFAVDRVGIKTGCGYVTVRSVAMQVLGSISDWQFLDRSLTLTYKAAGGPDRSE